MGSSSTECDYRHVETTALKGKKGLSVLKAMAANAMGTEQLHLSLLHRCVLLSVIDYGLGLTTIVQTNPLKLDRVQNEAMAVILGTTKNTPIETTRFMLDLPPMQNRQKVAKDTKGHRLGEAGLEWVKQRTQYCKYAS